ncbi:MAG: hypothetical protein ACK40X_14170 [Armatimonadota bacterium]
MWEAAIEANPDWVLITSWNEWHEGSEIEPSVENGDRELKTTAKYALRFKQLPPREVGKRTEKIPELGRDKLSAALQKTSIAILPNSDSECVWWLLSMNAKVKTLSWEQIVDAKIFEPTNFPFAVYGGGESYRASVREENDVLKSLQRYVQDGGTLMVLPSQPMPFHYDETKMPERKIVYHAPQLWLPLFVAWERPPQGKKLTFIVRDRKLMPNVPEKFPYPESGDLRWRPLLPEKAPLNSQVIPLIVNSTF